MLTDKQRQAWNEAVARSPKGIAGLLVKPVSGDGVPPHVASSTEQAELDEHERRLRAAAASQQQAREIEVPYGARYSLQGTKAGAFHVIEEDGVGRRVAATPPPYLVPNIPMPQQWDLSKSYDGVTDLTKPPHNLNRSALAFWYSLLDLVQHDTCYFWTLTAKEFVPDSWFGNMHSAFMKYMRDAAREGTIHEWWGGVRVFEPHPGGHGLHSHLVLRNRMPWSVVKACAEKAGLGRLNVHPDKVELPLIRYLCKYLMKSGSNMSGVRRWATVGTYEGVGKRDVIYSGKRADRIKELAFHNRMQGRHRFVAYQMACAQYREEEKDVMLKIQPGDKYFTHPLATKTKIDK